MTIDSPPPSPLDDDTEDAATEAAGEGRRRRRYPPAWSTLALVLGVALAIASISVEPPVREEVVVVDDTTTAGDEDDLGGPVEGAGTDSPTDAPGAQQGPGRTVRRQGESASGGPIDPKTGRPATNAVANQKGAVCAAGRNGGAIGDGVGASSIKLGATVVQSGLGASFLGDVRFALEAVKKKTNATGGICGREIDLKLVDDGWDFRLGGEYLRNLVEDDKVFALAVVPSSEGLKNVSDAGYLKNKKIPVIGTDGMLIGQYHDPYIWPVAASTVSTMHIMAKQAHDAGQKQFGLVYDMTYHFGIEGAKAFNQAVKRLTGSDILGYEDPDVKKQCKERFCGISADSDSYSVEIEKFNKACSDCDFIGLLLEPTSATKWMKGGALHPRQGLRVGGVQPLFTYDFGVACGDPCNGVWLWTGYTPPIGDFVTRPSIATYIEDIKGESSSADFNNQFVLGGYIGMSLTMRALKEAGPRLTRAGVVAVLDSMTFDTAGLAPVLKWSPGNHFANTHMRAYSMQFKGGFLGWRDEQTGYDDPWVGQL